MPYDDALAARFRKALGRTRNVSEKRMMGGLCFFVKGHMVGAVDRDKRGANHFMFRVGKENHSEAQSRPGARPMRQGGRVMKGFARVAESDCSDRDLVEWIQSAKSYVKGLPPK